MKSITLFSVVMLAACVELEDGAEPVENVPKLAVNALTPYQVWAAQPTFNPATLDAANLNAMAQTDEGRIALTYLVGCALNAGHSVGTVVQNTTYWFHGSVGVADGWTSAPLSLTQQRFVSSCVLARLNESGTTVTISLRGNNPAYAISGTESRQYTSEEGAFFGNVFPGSDFYVGSCRGSGNLLPSRTCATSTGNCGIDWVGNCADVCTAGDYFTGCQGATTYNEVTTVFLAL